MPRLISKSSSDKQDSPNHRSAASAALMLPSGRVIPVPTETEIMSKKHPFTMALHDLPESVLDMIEFTIQLDRSARRPAPAPQKPIRGTCPCSRSNF